MTLYNINVASEINATFVTHCGGFNCNIYNATARDFIYTQNILFTGMKGREEFFHIFLLHSFLFKLQHFQQCNNVSTLSKTETTIVL